MVVYDLASATCFISMKFHIRFLYKNLSNRLELSENVSSDRQNLWKDVN